MIKAIFWDNDGVLVDTERLYFLANKQIFESIGIYLTPELYVENFLRNGTGVWHLAEEKGLNPDRIKELRDLRNELYSKFLLEGKILLKGVEEVLSHLHKKYIMGIVTSSRKDHFDLIHRSTNILRYFDFILTGEDFTRFKPDPQPYLMALEKTNLKKEECIIIEDSERGLSSANAAGIKCIVIPHELTQESNFVGAYKVLSNIGEVVSEMETLNSNPSKEYNN
jgi:HAD superfamily hydrolase (TIGR01509 family)